ncbi:MAG: type III pantothenate kinase [Gammaproteobacteria bacterium]|nr:type III pantothenate kinase [Gammaproteobacteria bacterium]
MNIYIDAGNTNIKCLLSKKDSDEFQVIPAVHYKAGLSQLLEDCSNVDQIWVSSVLSNDFNSWLIGLADGLGFSKPVFVQSVKACCGVSIAYDVPEQFGVDRFLALLAAYHNSKQDQIVVDVGTAITVDALLATGRHLGGVIIPGYLVMQNALIRSASAIGDKTQGSLDIYSKNTADALTTGCYYAVLEGMNGIIRQMLQKFEGCPRITLTGGGAGLFKSEIKGDVKYFENLVLDGLKVMAKNS